MLEVWRSKGESARIVYFGTLVPLTNSLSHETSSTASLIAVFFAGPSASQVADVSIATRKDHHAICTKIVVAFHIRIMNCYSLPI